MGDLAACTASTTLAGCDLSEVGERAGTGDRVLQAEDVHDRDLDQPADMGDGSEPLEVIGGGNGVLAAAALSTELARPVNASKRAMATLA